MKNQDWLGKHNTHVVDAGTPHCLHPHTLAAYVNMQHAAHSDNIDLQLVSSFRSFERQLHIWNRKWSGQTPLLDVNSTPLDPSKLSDKQKLDAILTWSALPGGSRHHWGTDMDVYDKRAVSKWNDNFSLVAHEYDVNGPCYALSQWLSINMQRFGFIRPFNQYRGGVACEPWHISHENEAKHFEDARSDKQLLNSLSSCNIEGFDTIKKHFDYIYTCYVLNEGKS